MACPQRKFIMGQFYRTQDFHFKIHFEPFWIHSDKKISAKNFCLCHFMKYDRHFSKKWLCHQTSHKRIFFEIKAFILKYVLDYSESIPIKKKFGQNFFIFAIFSDQKWTKLEVWRFLSKKCFSEKNFYIFF